MTKFISPSHSLAHLADIMALLRNPERGCPWDVEQTFETIAPHTIEEAYEVLDAIHEGKPEAIQDELGDLLLQVVFQSRIAEETGLFTLNDVITGICDKLVRRHPHVFGDMKVDDAEKQTVNWENVKESERAKSDQLPSALDGVAKALPALMRAAKLQKRASRVGFDWTEYKDVINKIREELDEFEHELNHEKPELDRLEDEIGDVIFAVTNLARKLDMDPEAALRRTNDKFERRFRFIETELQTAHKDIRQTSLDEMEELWQKAKTLETKEVLQ